jgi:hypothetical protein
LIRALLRGAQSGTGKTHSLISTRGDKVLNQRAESKRDGRVANFAAVKNKFTNHLRLKVPPDRFQSAAPRYADK